MTFVPVRVPAGPLRRLGAMLYDSLLVIAVLMVATIPFLPALGEKQALVPQDVGAVAYVYWGWEFIVLALYFGYFWASKGRTLGMQAWRICIVRIDSAQPTWVDAMARFASAWIPWLPALLTMSVAEHVALPVMPIGIALLGLGLVNYFAAYVSPDRRTLHERWLSTRIVRE